MKTQMTFFFTLALLALLARAETSYDDFILNLKFPLQNYRLLHNDVQIETVSMSEDLQCCIIAQTVVKTTYWKRKVKYNMFAFGYFMIYLILSNITLSSCSPRMPTYLQYLSES